MPSHQDIGQVSRRDVEPEWFCKHRLTTSFILQPMSTAKDAKVSTMPFDSTLYAVGRDGNILTPASINSLVMLCRCLESLGAIVIRKGLYRFPEHYVLLEEKTLNSAVFDYDR